MRQPSLADLAALDDAAFREVFAGSPIKRIGRDRFLRNVLIAIGNAGKEQLVASAEPHLGDPNPIVRGAAIWALSRLMNRADLTRLCVADPDPDVNAEWQAACA